MSASWSADSAAQNVQSATVLTFNSTFFFIFRGKNKCKIRIQPCAVMQHVCVQHQLSVSCRNVPLKDLQVQVFTSMNAKCMLNANTPKNSINTSPSLLPGSHSVTG